jgi:hypothetical protein
MAKQLKNKGPQPAWSRKPLSEDQKRSMAVATKKFNKNFKPASGRVESTVDEVGQSVIRSGPGGFGVKSTGGFNLSKSPKAPGSGKGSIDSEESAYGPKRPAKPVKADKDFVRKSKTKLTLKKVSNGKTTKK